MPSKDRYDPEKRRAEYLAAKADPEKYQRMLEAGRDYDQNRRQRDPEVKRESVRKATEKAKARDPEGFARRQRESAARSYVKHADKRRAEQRARSQTPEAREKAKLYAREWRKKNPSYARSCRSQLAVQVPGTTSPLVVPSAIGQRATALCSSICFG